MKIISFTQSKGGTGKTTSVINCGYGLAKLGYKVLLIDFDNGMSLTDSFNMKDKVPGNVGSFLLKRNAFEESVISFPALDLMPSCLELEEMENELAGKSLRDLLLKKAIEPHKQKYDYILIDTPPNLGVMTNNALVASDSFIIPFEPEFYSYKRLVKLLHHIENIRELGNPGIELCGILVTQFNKKNRVSIINDIYEKLMNSNVGPYVFETVIRRNAKLIEAASQFQSIYEYDPACNGATDYMNLCKEIIKRGN